MISLFWGLCGALLIGGSDCIARVTAQRVSVSVLFLFIMGLSFVSLSMWLLMSANWPPWHASAWIASAISGWLNLVALFFLYRALARGPVAVASPVASTFTVFLLALNIFSGEPWSALQIVAMVVVFLGVVMLARPVHTDSNMEHFDSNWLRGTAYYALGAAAAVSLRMFLAQEAGSELGPMHALYLNRAFALLGAVALVFYVISQQASLAWPQKGTIKLVVLQAVLETLALGAFLIGSASGGRISATIGFSTFAVATALFAWWWLGERIGWQRGFWMLIVSVGVTFAAIAGELT